MRAERLARARAEGLWADAPGPVLALCAVAGDDLSALGPDLKVEADFLPDHRAFAARGLPPGSSLDPVPAQMALALVCLPRARALAHAMMHRAMSALGPGGRMVLDGQKTDGIEAAIRELRGLGLTLSDPVSKAHGKLVLVDRAALPDDWADRRRDLGGFVTRPGVFSADGVDPASALLDGVLPGKLPHHMADLGAGWGYLSRAVLARDGVQSLDLVEADRRALACARENLDDPRARFLWEDVPAFTPPRKWQGVVMNPPFHSGRTTDPGLGAAFLRAAARGLSGDGQLWVVFNRHLPYPDLIAELFHKVEPLADQGGFRVIRAEGVKRARI